MNGLPLLEARLFNVPLMAEESRAVSVAQAFGKRQVPRETPRVFPKGEVIRLLLG